MIGIGIWTEVHLVIGFRKDSKRNQVAKRSRVDIVEIHSGRMDMSMHEHVYLGIQNKHNIYLHICVFI